MNPGAIDAVKGQQETDPTKFAHLFIFENEAAQEAHSRSEAVGRFESVYSPELVSGPVVFTDFSLVADNSN